MTVISIEEIYQEILDGKRKRFPHGTWQDKEMAARCIRYLMEHVLKWSMEEIPKKTTRTTFIKHKLAGMLAHACDDSPYICINIAYPGVFKPWELAMSPMNFWNRETGIEATKWLIEEKLQWTKEEIKERLNAKIFQENGLSGMLQHVFSSSPFLAIDAAYPNCFHPWELSKAPLNFWDLEKGIQATKWLIEEKLQWSKDDMKEKLNKEIFKEHGLYGMLQQVFKDNYFDAIHAAYPDVFQPWEFSTVPQAYWNRETGIAATKWLIEEKLRWSEKDIKEQLNLRTFEDNGLSGMLQVAFNNSAYAAIEAAYPNRFQPWELPQTPHKFWSKETGIRAVKWLIEEKLHWSEQDIKEKISLNVFKEYGLGGMIGIVFNHSPYMAIDAAYPHTFKPWEFPMAPIKYWNVETGIEATKWLIEEKLKWSEEDVKEKISVKVFYENGLSGMLTHVFNSSPYMAICATYPNLFPINDVTLHSKMRKSTIEHIKNLKL